eukprot:jgi/Chlat1/5838/Chrsp4S06360
MAGVLARAAAGRSGGLRRVCAGAWQALTEAQTTTAPFGVRHKSDATDLYSKLEEIIPKEQERLVDLKKTHGHKVLGKVIGGMRGIKGLLWEPSLLDEEEGIRFRGFSIPECQAQLPSAVQNGEPIPEGLFWLLVTGEVPTKEQAASVTAEFQRRAGLPSYVHDVLNALPDDAHPMTQLVTGVMALQTKSKFSAAYAKGMNKKLFWQPVYEDSLDLIAKLPELAATIYRKTFKGGKYISSDPNLDWSANYAHMMGYDSEEVKELLRLYLTIHADHEGGNVSAHATHLVGSALADPYLSYAAGMNGLAGPLHGLANQEVLGWLKQINSQLGSDVSKEQLTNFIEDTLKAGKVVPGYGHAVLRKTDPRYTCQREFALKHLPEDPMFRVVSLLYEVVPDILIKTGKVKNPWPNHYGITEERYYTVMFGVSRALGVLAQLIWDRALGLPIERPKSLTSAWLRKHAQHTE